MSNPRGKLQIAKNIAAWLGHTRRGQSKSGPMAVKKLLRKVLDDLCTRFVINIPDDEIEDPIRVFFVLEQAHW